MAQPSGQPPLGHCVQHTSCRQHSHIEDTVIHSSLYSFRHISPRKWHIFRLFTLRRYITSLLFSTQCTFLHITRQHGQQLANSIALSSASVSNNICLCARFSVDSDTLQYNIFKMNKKGIIPPCFVPVISLKKKTKTEISIINTYFLATVNPKLYGLVNWPNALLPTGLCIFQTKNTVILWLSIQAPCSIYVSTPIQHFNPSSKYTTHQYLRLL